MLRRATAFVIVLVAGSTGTVAAPAYGAFPGANGTIAFSGGFGCGYDRGAIASIDPDGNGLRVLTECDYFAYAPNWSADGRSLLYTTYRTIWVMAADGSGRREVSLGSAPSLAPDGRHYAYLRGPGLSKSIRRAGLDGSDDRLLRAGRSPRWAPDGRTIAYSRHGVWIMNARNGKRLRRVASDEFVPLDWSPNGRRLLCVRYFEGSGPGGVNGDLFVVRADGVGSPRRLTRTTNATEQHAAWSPDGHRIVFAVTSAPRRYSLRHSLWTMTTRGTRRTRIWKGPTFLEENENRATESPPSVSWQPLPSGA